MRLTLPLGQRRVERRRVGGERGIEALNPNSPALAFGVGHADRDI